jgi:hypothetical protein
VRAAIGSSRENYRLTDKGLALIPLLIELANRGVSFGPEVIPNPAWIAKATSEPQALRELAQESVLPAAPCGAGPTASRPAQGCIRIQRRRQADLATRPSTPAEVRLNKAVDKSTRHRDA